MRYGLADYLLDNYGRCVAAKCLCHLDGWLGRACPHWRPMGATTWDELRRTQAALRRKPDGGE